MQGVVRAWLLVVVLSLGCGTARFVLHGAPAQPFDAVIVPGCPSNDDGGLTLCQMSRVLWAARLWELGWARNFITTGNAVYSPYVEAEALAAGLAAVGVPPEHIYLEPAALHTDENMYYSLRIARALGFRRLAVAAEAAPFDCKMLLDWGQDQCIGFSIDRDWVRERHKRSPGVLEKLRTARVANWISLVERERAIAERTGRHRPPSYFLYLELAILRLNGERWIPPGTPPRPTRRTWAEHLAAR